MKHNKITILILGNPNVRVIQLLELGPNDPTSNELITTVLATGQIARRLTLRFGGINKGV